MIPVLWIALAYAACRTLSADTIPQVIAYGLLFSMAGALLAFFDDVVSE